MKPLQNLQQSLAQLIDEYTNKNPKSESTITGASSVLPGGTTRSVLIYKPFPICFAGGIGPKLTSVDGHEYLDFVSEYFAGMFGHSHPKIINAVENVLKTGFTLGGPNLFEGELAKLLVARFPSVDSIRFCNSGTEANTMAIATALAYNRRKKVMVFENGYHGGTLSFSKANPMILPHDFVYGHFNDIERTRLKIDIEIGAILVEPLQGSAGLIPGNKEFLKFLRDEATRIGAVLIFDEVVTSRLWYGGLQEFHNIMPDMTTVGKHFGGGFSFGAFGGSKSIMELFDPISPRCLYHSGTWNNNLFSMSAGVEATKLLTREAIERTNELGDALREGIRKLFDEKHPGLLVARGWGSVVGIYFNGPDAATLRETLYFYMLNNNIYMGPRGFIALNITHEQEHVDMMLAALEKFCDEILYFRPIETYRSARTIAVIFCDDKNSANVPPIDSCIVYAYLCLYESAESATSEFTSTRFFIMPPQTSKISQNSQAACDLLSKSFPDKTLLRGTPVYELARSQYWARVQQEATQACIFQPVDASDVSAALLILKQVNCPFAIKSGGHGKFHGESSIDGGVTIDLACINHINLSEDGRTVVVGPGNRWREVYMALQPFGLTVVGGRASTVGVGGFLLGGGISFFTNIYGFAMDNIRSFEVVLADGSIVNADKQTSPDLYKTLRGSGANLGIVTSFSLDTIPYTGMYGGHRIFEPSQSEDVMRAFLKYGENIQKDPKAFVILAITTDEEQWVWATGMYYCDKLVDAPAFSDIKAIPAVLDDSQVQEQTDLIETMASSYPCSIHNTFWVLSTKPDAHILRYMAKAWAEEMDHVREVEGMKAQLAIQYFSDGVIKGGTRRGGNALGSSIEEPFIMYNAEPQWARAEDTPRVLAAVEAAFRRTEAEAKRRAVLVDYLYSNYASQYQDPFGSYSQEARVFVKRTADKYDPDGVFQQLRGAGFKLTGTLTSATAKEELKRKKTLHLHL
ncbi:hypothetical protein V500_04121 [Pseudogymnoascus sp. VKM F-4518 (FW-2643)]|nr:hypothetical protein V500_04121 [Pseudogymnoascus sp. VKM F-4518 (FW-2643)]